MKPGRGQGLPVGPFLLVDFAARAVRFLDAKELEGVIETDVFAAAASPGAFMWFVRPGDPRPRGLLVRLRPEHAVTVETDPPVPSDVADVGYVDADGEMTP